RVNPTFDRVSLPANITLRERQRRAAGYRDLLAHQIESRHQLSHRMLYLQTSVHLEKIKIARHVRIEKLNCAGAHVVHAPGNLDRRLAHPLSQIFIVEWRWTLLNHLLVTPLNRAFALAEMDVVTMLVS